MDGASPAPSVSGGEVCSSSFGITVTPTSGLTTTEALGTDTFTVVLDSQPTANVTLSILSDDLTEGAALPAALTFTDANWDTPQTVTVAGIDDTIVDGNIAYTIVTGDPTSADSDYNDLGADDVDDVSVTNTDNDVASITVTPTSGLITTEAGGTDT
ncbi:MAG: calcium-binding protein, partial [Lentisphaeria bacterium]|nr:calcium-binding protein [Lentisphaeria bacterium]